MFHMVSICPMIGVFFVYKSKLYKSMKKSLVAKRTIKVNILNLSFPLDGLGSHHTNHTSKYRDTDRENKRK